MKRVKLMFAICLSIGILLLTGCGGVRSLLEPLPASNSEEASQDSTEVGGYLEPQRYSPSRPEYQESRNPYARAGGVYAIGQCTWYVFGRIQELDAGLPSFLQDYNLLKLIFTDEKGNTVGSRLWDDEVAKLQEKLRGTQWEGLQLRVDNKMREKSIAVWDAPNKMGHVAFVESPDGKLTESNAIPTRAGQEVIINSDDGKQNWVPIYDAPYENLSGIKPIGYAKQYSIMKVEEIKVLKNGRWCKLTPVEGDSVAGWALHKALISNVVFNFTVIYRTPHNNPVKPDKYIHLNVPEIPKNLKELSVNLIEVSTNKWTWTATLAWDPSPRANSYEIQIATDQDFNKIIYTMTTKQTQVTVNLSTQTKDCWWRVRAKNDDGSSPWSTKRSLNPIIIFIYQLNGDSLTVIREREAVRIVWFTAFVMSAPNESKVKFQIEIRRITEPFTGTPTLESELVPSGTSIILYPLNLGDGRYKWRYRAVDETGLASQWIEFGTPGNTDFIVDKTPPTVPGNVRVTASTFTRIDIAWNPSTDNVSGVQAYRIYRDGQPYATVQAPRTSFSDTNVKLGQRYCYQVSAVDNAGNESAKSNQACARAVPWPRFYEF